MNLQTDRPGFIRLTASDRPGMAQPVPERDIPARPWGIILLIATIMFVILVAAWEHYWRDYGATPSYQNSKGAWADQRRRIDQGEGNTLVLIGSSRVLFGLQLPVWEKAGGERPIQLSLEGTTPLLAVEDLANDANFNGRLVIGVAPDLFFSGFAYRGDVVAQYHTQSPSQRVGYWLSKHLLEPYFAFYDPDFALDTVVKRQAWPPRPGVRGFMPVRKLMVADANRNAHMWSKVENDPVYQNMAQRIWAQRFAGPPPPMMDTPEKMQALVSKQIGRAADAIAKLRKRGVQVVFIRMPSAGDYYAFEQKAFPRATTWDVLLQKTNTPGIHFEDYPQLQGYTLPEWSHLSHAEADRFTAAVVPIVQQIFAGAPKQ